MYRKGFIAWYFGAGIKEMCAIWKRLIVCGPRIFSMWLFVRTLFSPWHRDVSPKDWRGFSPTRSLQRLIWNLMSRGVGAVVRVIMIMSGIFVSFVLFVVGGILILLYVAMPIVVIGGVVAAFVYNVVVGFGMILISGIMLMYVLYIYRMIGHVSYRTMSIAQLHYFKWFKRVYELIGVDPDTVSIELVSDRTACDKFLHDNNVSVEEFSSLIDREISRRVAYEQKAHILSQENFARMRPIGMRWHFGYTIHLDQYVEDLTLSDHSSYMQYSFQGFDQELSLIEVVLARPNENNVMITGEVGTGRHMIVHELARRIREGYYDGSFLQHMRILSCDLMSVIAQARNAGEDPGYVVRRLFHEAAYAGNVILVVDNFEQYMRIDHQYGISFTALIDEYASLSTFRMIGIATEQAFHEQIDTDRVLMRHFDVVPVHEMTDEDAMHVLLTRFCDVEKSMYTYQGLRQVLTDAARYMNTAPLPMRAINVAMEVLIYWSRVGSGYITASVVDDFITQKTGIPVGSIDADEQNTLLSLEDLIHQRIVGQDAAVRTVASAVRRMRSGMARPHRPAGSFLFLGPTGVGKTEMAKVVAQQYFGDAERVIRVDMSEYHGANAVDRLIGSKELGQQGVFVSQVREHPYALILLDEIEKADESVLDLFLQVLDEGFLHDAFGRKVNFETTIIIATSNAGALNIIKMIESGIDPSLMEKKVVETVMASKQFRPEFINRFDDVVIFTPLRDEDVSRVVGILLGEFAQRMSDEQDVSVQFDEAVVQHVIQNGFDPVFGARSLHHYIDDAIGDALAKKLIRGNVRRGENVYFTVSDLT